LYRKVILVYDMEKKKMGLGPQARLNQPPSVTMTERPKILLIGGTCLLLSALLTVVYLRGESQAADPAAQAAATPYKNTFFDPDPNHPWNQLYGLLFIRPAWNGKLYGLDELDPLYYQSTRYLLEQPLHHKALTIMDQFIQADSAHLIRDPLKRALLQHMLWALFDTWSNHFDPYQRDKSDFTAERRALQVRLVKIMKAVALTDNEINALSDNLGAQVRAKTYPLDYDPAKKDQPFLPASFYSQTEWVSLANQYEQLAPVHVEALSGRSGFDVFMSLPGGREATLNYLKNLNGYQPKWVYDQDKASHFVNVGNAPPYLSADLPQVPPLTKFALVRKANLIDTEGKIVQSPIIESIQLRVIRTELPNNSSGGEQSFFMFELDPSKLMQGQGGLTALRPDEQGFDGVFKGEDLIEQRGFRGGNSHGEFARLQGCFACHSRAGIFSMNSYIQFFQNHRTLEPPKLEEGDSASYSLGWKEQQYNWGLLQAYWFSQ
jgi:hypothetical protein